MEGATQAFYKHLPLSNMLCDVSLFCGESRLAQVPHPTTLPYLPLALTYLHGGKKVYCKECELKMCAEVCAVVHQEGSGREGHCPSTSSWSPEKHLPPSNSAIVPCSYVDWTVPTNSYAAGLVQGLGGLVHELAGGISNALYDPVRGLSFPVPCAGKGVTGGLCRYLHGRSGGGHQRADIGVDGVDHAAACGQQCAADEGHARHPIFEPSEGSTDGD